MRIAWALPCRWVRAGGTPGLLNLLDCQLDTVVVDSRFPGYDLSNHVGARIAFEPSSEGGYDLSFALDGKLDTRHNTTVSVRLLDSN